MYIIFSGAPGGRKSTSIAFVRDLLEQATAIRFAPDDTGGQRQGLIKAITANDMDEEHRDIKQIAKDSNLFNGDGERNPLANLMSELSEIKFDLRDPHSMYISASELKSFIGENNTQMHTFLIKLWDGEKYEYELRNASYLIKTGLLGMIGATTQSELTTMLPPAAMGSGFISRIIFVYSPGPAKKVHKASLDKTVEPFLLETFQTVFEKFSGPFEITPGADRLDGELYNRGVSIKDTRFQHYCERRRTHLQKVAMCLAASRGGMVVEELDIQIADRLLALTEDKMPEALGEFGLNRSSQAKQKLMEFIANLDAPMPMSALYYMMSRDMLRVDFENTIVELANGKKIKIFALPELGQCVIGISEGPAKRAAREKEELRRLLE